MCAEPRRAARSGMPQAAAPPVVELRDLDTLWFQVGGTVCNLACTHCFVSCSPTNHTHEFLRLDEIRGYPIVIAVAGMEGAIFSVLGGLVEAVLIAVPTSVSYGAGPDGQLALHAALGSCAPGIVTVNIDNGYGAACAAIRVMNHWERARRTT